MTFLLASWLFTHAWAWTPVPVATSYRLYYGPHPAKWCPMQFAEVTAQAACTETECQFSTPEPTGKVIFFNVTALNSGGESTWDHGSKVCP